MESNNEIIELVKSYLIKNNQSEAFWKISSIKEIIPLAQLIVVMGTAIFGLYKYYKTKDREIYEKKLKGVYAPLYKRIVKQEFFRHILFPNQEINIAPIITMQKKETITKFDSKSLNMMERVELKSTGFLNRQDFIKIMDGIDSGLASYRLVTLIGLYESAVYLEENLEIGSKNYCEVTIIKVKIEYDLVIEIIRGYKECLKRLDLGEPLYYLDNWNMKDDKFEILYKASDEEVIELQKEILKHPITYK